MSAPIFSCFGIFVTVDCYYSNCCVMVNWCLLMHVMSLCYTSTSEVTDKKEKPRVLRLGRISASAFIHKSKSCRLRPDR